MSAPESRWPIARWLDAALDRSVLLGYSAVGPAIRTRLPGWPDPPQRLHGAQVLVTGASSGLGTAIAAQLTALGAHVHWVVRDPDKAHREIARHDAIARHDLGAASTVWRCDVSDLDSVADFTQQIGVHLTSTDTKLSAIVHNAGAMPGQRTESRQGHELTMALHVLGPVAMTEQLLPHMVQARVVLVTSGGMYAQRLRADDPEFIDGGYSPTTAYARSKRAQVELLGRLQRRWGSAGHMVAAMHPGWAATPGITQSLPRFARLVGPVLRDADSGADTAVWLVGGQPRPPGGLLWHDRRPRPSTWFGRNACSDADRERMWAWVVEQTDLDATRPGDDGGGS